MAVNTIPTTVVISVNPIQTNENRINRVSVVDKTFVANNSPAQQPVVPKMFWS